MNALADNPFTKILNVTGKKIPKPSAICVISAHWLTKGSYVSVTRNPETIHDFYGFPQELFSMSYPAPGSPEYAEKLAALSPVIKKDPERGLDHGAWSVLVHLFPEADIPVFQLSIDFHQPMDYHFDLAKHLAPLRNEGVLFIGSGNIVHNLSMVDFNDNAVPFDWAEKFDGHVAALIEKRDFDGIINYEQSGKSARLSVPTTDHYIPLIYTLGLVEKSEPIETIFEGIDLASISMRSVLLGQLPQQN